MQSLAFAATSRSAILCTALERSRKRQGRPCSRAQLTSLRTKAGTPYPHSAFGHLLSEREGTTQNTSLAKPSLPEGERWKPQNVVFDFRGGRSLDGLRNMADISIPTISLESLNSPTHRATSVRTIGQALEQSGFFIVEDHGISSEKIAECYRVAEMFFTLPEEI